MIGEARPLYAQFESMLSRFLPGFSPGTRSPTPVKNALLARDGIEDEIAYDFKSPIASISPEIEKQLIHSLSETRAFRRLNDIRFLGALDYFIVTGPNGLPHNSRFSRAQHSLGVAALAQSYLKFVDRTAHDRLVCVAAAMLHDIGHTPFSHTLEPLFKEVFGLDHHIVSEAMIRGDDPGFEDIRRVLSEFYIDPQEIIAVLNGEDSHFDFFFSGPINFDTIEGILRSRQYIKMSPTGLSPTKVVEAATKRNNSSDALIVDNFWQAKHDIYNVVIRSAYGAMLDLVFKELVSTYKDELSPNDFYLTDLQAFKKFPALRCALDLQKFDALRERLVGDEIDVLVRTFFVDETVEFASREDRRRYRQSKEAKKLTLPKLKASFPDWPLGERHESYREGAYLF